MTTTELIRAAMAELEQMPCGGIGPDGATQKSLNYCDKAGRYFNGDATYHRSQQAWLHLKAALKQLEERP